MKPRAIMGPTSEQLRRLVLQEEQCFSTRFVLGQKYACERPHPHPGLHRATTSEGLDLVWAQDDRA